MRYFPRFLLPILLVSQLLLAPAAMAADWLYTVRPEDKLWTLAQRFCGTHERWREIAEYNQIADPLRLTPGSQLRFPVKWLIEEPVVVRVVYARGDVKVERRTSGGTAAAGGEEALFQGTDLHIGSKVITGVNSYANVLFADGSSMQIGPESEVVFDVLSAYRDTGMVDTRVRINRGSGASTVKPQKGPESVYRISTPLGVAAVRGTEFRTRADQGASFVETVGGVVDYIAATGTTSVERGFGLKASSAGISLEALLEAPELTTPRVMGVFESLTWQPLDAAEKYIVQIYSGANLAQVLAKATVGGPEFSLASLQPGNYVFGVRGVAASGLQGYEATKTLDIQNVMPAPDKIRVKQPYRSTDLQVVWNPVAGASSYRVVATPVGGGEAIIETTGSNKVQFTNLEHGNYSISVQASSAQITGAVSEPVEQRVRRRIIWGIGIALVVLVIAVVL